MPSAAKPRIETRYRIVVLLGLYALTVGVGPSPACAATFTDRTLWVFQNLGVGGGNAAWGDFNKDGWVDLADGWRLWRNVGGAEFELVTTLDNGFWGDYDNDGYPDYLRGGRRLYHNNGGQALNEVGFPSLPAIVSRGAAWGDFDNDGFLDVYVGGYESPEYQPDTIFTNNGNGTFSNTWTQSGDIDPARGIATCDFNKDGYIDVYVSNYRLEANLLWKNDRDGTFTNVAKSYGAAGDYNGYSWSYGHTIGSAWGDLDNDGHIDLFVGNFSHPHEDQDRPKFLKNLGPSGDYHFQDMSGSAGLAWQESFASPTLGDYDNDGDLDLFFSTVYGGDASVLYRNDGNWNFTNVTGSAGLSNLRETYQAGWADFDNDGDLDLLTRATIFVNAGNGNHWLKVHLRGDGELVNSGAVGAQVRISVGGKTLTRHVGSATGEGNQNDPTLHFGLGAHDGPVDLEIFWPGGVTQTITGVAIDEAALFQRPEAGAPVNTNLYVGYTGQKTFDHSFGVTTVPGFLSLGFSGGSAGTYELSGTGKIRVAGQALLGVLGSGTFIQRDQAEVTVGGDLVLASAPGSAGTYELHGGVLQASRTRLGAGGTATFVQTGGELESDETIVGHSSAGTFQQSGGVHRVDTLYVGKDASGPGLYMLSSTSVEESATKTSFTRVDARTIEGTEYNVYDMLITTETDWTKSRLDLDLSTGQMYQNALGGNTEPITALIAIFPDLAWDTYAAVPAGSPSTASFAGTPTLDADTFGASWSDSANTGAGTHKIARITLSADADGTFSGTSYDLDNAGEGVEFSGSIADGRFTAAGNLVAGNAYIGHEGTGTVVHTSGAATIVGILTLGLADASQGTYSLGGSGDLATNLEIIGSEGTGRFAHIGGLHTAGYVALGAIAGSRGTYELSGTGRFRAQQVIVGQSGVGVVEQTGGSAVVQGALVLGNGAGSQGLYSISGGELSAGTILVGGQGSGALVLADADAEVHVTESLTFGPNGLLSAVAGATIHMDGAWLDNQSTNATSLAGLADTALVFEGAAMGFEVAGKDMGPAIAGFSDNFALDALILGGLEAGNVGLIDLFDNQPDWSGAEALYVETLIIEDGSTLNLNGLHLYVLALDDRGGTVLGGDVTVVSAAIPGDADLNGSVSDSDLSLLLANWGSETATWGQGEFNGTPPVNDDDLSLLLANWTGSPAAIPEPVTTGLMAAAFGIWLTGRRRRRS